MRIALPLASFGLGYFLTLGAGSSGFYAWENGRDAALVAGATAVTLDAALLAWDRWTSPAHPAQVPLAGVRGAF